MARAAKKPPTKKAQKPQPKKAPVRAAKAAPPKPPALPAPPPKVVTAVVEKPAPPRKPARNPLTEKEMAQVKEDLDQLKEKLGRELSDLESTTLSIAQSELSGEASFDEEYADAGTFTFERERDLSLGNNIRDLLEKVDHALRRVAGGTYGVCERCGEPIDKARLKALPYSTLCVRCKQLEEGYS